MAFGDNQIDGYEDGQKPLGFHHKTGEYRETEPLHIQEIASGKKNEKRGFFRVLVSTRGNRSMFVVLCIAFALVILISLFGKNPNEATVSGAFCNLKSFAFDDKVYVTLEVRESDAEIKKSDTKKKEKIVEPKLLHAHFDMYNTDKEIAETRDADCLYDGASQFIRETFQNYDFIEIKCTVTCNGKSAILTSKVEQR
jgi:hypothetical protein